MGVYIPEERYPRWDPKEIIHARLEILSRADGEPLVFHLTRVETDAGDLEAGIEDYAQRVASPGMVRPASQALTSPWDLPVTQQCFVLFELDELVPNWQFNGRGLLSKHQPKGYDFGLRWVSPTDQSIQKGDIDEDGVRVIYLNVAHRLKKPDHHFTDIYVEFLQGNGGAIRMPIIFDPDIKNEGGEEFP